MTANPTVDNFGNFFSEKRATPQELIADAQAMFDWLNLKTAEDALECFYENGEFDEISFGRDTTTVRVGTWLLYIAPDGRRQSICFETVASASGAMEDF